MNTELPTASTTIDLSEAFSILEFIPRKSGEAKVTDPSFIPKIIQRTHDGAIFKIGDEVSNGANYQGKPCRGVIKEFSFLEEKVFVRTTWNGVGWSLGSLQYVVTLPCKFQRGDKVWINFWGAHPSGEIIAIHFYANTVKYDLEVCPDQGDSARLYNIEERMLSLTLPPYIKT